MVILMRVEIQHKKTLWKIILQIAIFFSDYRFLCNREKLIEQKEVR